MKSTTFCSPTPNSNPCAGAGGSGYNLNFDDLDAIDPFGAKKKTALSTEGEDAVLAAPPPGSLPADDGEGAARGAEAEPPQPKAESKAKKPAPKEKEKEKAVEPPAPKAESKAHAESLKGKENAKAEAAAAAPAKRGPATAKGTQARPLAGEGEGGEEERIPPKVTYNLEALENADVDPFGSKKPKLAFGDDAPLRSVAGAKNAASDGDERPVGGAKAKMDEADSESAPVSRPKAKKADAGDAADAPAGPFYAAILALSHVLFAAAEKPWLKGKAAAAKKAAPKRPAAAKREESKEEPKSEANEGGGGEDDIPVPKKGYNLNFDDMDALDPFGTKKKPPAFSDDIPLSSKAPKMALEDQPVGGGGAKAKAESAADSGASADGAQEKDAEKAPAKRPAAKRPAPKRPIRAAAKTEHKDESEEIKQEPKAEAKEGGGGDDDIPVPKKGYNINFDDLDGVNPFGGGGAPPKPKMAMDDAPLKAKPTAAKPAAGPPEDASAGGPEEKFDGPLEKRLVHSAWKARDQAYKELKAQLLADDDVPSLIDQYAGLLTAIAGEKSPAIAESSLDLVKTFLDKGYGPGKRKLDAGLADELMPLLVNGFKGKGKGKAVDGVMVMIELGCVDNVLPALSKGCDDKAPKNAVTCGETVRQAVREFSPRVVPLPAATAIMTKMLNNGNTAVRKEGMELACEIFRWMGSVFAPQLAGIELRPPVRKELDAQIANTKTGESKPTRYLKGQAPAAGKGKAGAKGGKEEKEEAFDPMAMLKPVDIVKKLLKDSPCLSCCWVP